MGLIQKAKNALLQIYTVSTYAGSSYVCTYVSRLYNLVFAHIILYLSLKLVKRKQ